MLNLAGHSHNYERTFPQQGVTHVTVGTGGGGLETDGSCLWRACQQPSWSAFRAMHHGALKLQFTEASIEGAFVCGPESDRNDFACGEGDAIDIFVIQAGSAGDTTPPSAPANLTATAISESQIELVWSAPTDDTGIAGYRIMRDGEQIARQQTTSYLDQGLSPATPYIYTVSAFDAAGNVSEPSPAASVTTLGSSTPVILAFTPIADATIKSDSPTSNYGSIPTLEADGNPVAEFLMKFEVTGTSGKTIESAMLQLNNRNSSNHGGSFFQAADNAWGESTITWNNAPDVTGPLITTLGPVISGMSYGVDLTPLITGDGTFGVHVRSSATDGADYDAREGSTPPRLSITLKQVEQTQTLVFAPTDDSTIDASSPARNHGEGTKLEADASPTQEFLLRFSVAGVGTRQIRSATLRLYNINASDQGGQFYRITDTNWSENLVTWSTAPAASDLIASLGSVVSGTWYEIDVTSLVAGDGAVSLRVGSTSSNGADYASKDSAEFAPELVVVMDVDG